MPPHNNGEASATVLLRKRRRVDQPSTSARASFDSPAHGVANFENNEGVPFLVVIQNHTVEFLRALHPEAT